MADDCRWPRCACKATGNKCETQIRKESAKGKRKHLKRISVKRAAEAPQRQEQHLGDHIFYTIIWWERDHKCQNCGNDIIEFSLLWFHHILPKRKAGGYPQYRRCKWNIWILCWHCHDTHDNGNIDSKLLLPLRTEYYRLLSLHDAGALRRANPNLPV